MPQGPPSGRFADRSRPSIIRPQTRPRRSRLHWPIFPAPTALSGQPPGSPSSISRSHSGRRRALALGDPEAVIAAAIAVAHQADPPAQPAVLAALDRIDPASLDTAARIDLARAYELAIVRLGLPAADVRGAVAAKFVPYFPSGSFDLDRELSSLLVALRAPGIVAKLVGMLASPSASAAATNLGPNEEDVRRLLERNAHYGGDVRKSLEKRADLLQIHYAYLLRTVAEKDAWSEADRRGYYEWFSRAREWDGGNSFRKFLNNIEQQSLAGLSENEKLALETLGIRKPYTPPPLPKPEGPGRTWTTEEVLAIAQRPGAEGIAKGRDFAHGRQAFAAARCIVCHRYGIDGAPQAPISPRPPAGSSSRTSSRRSSTRAEWSRTSTRGASCRRPMGRSSAAGS